ncbi:MAG: hypothetical protein RBR19_12100 [Sedimentisphaerales bacterium]|jgi:hypothetical protein|nr:hypothetical protein [Planctomycetota bacterium]MDY0356617.1 hypothetical protein [Sedimentisphaerales bacterium]
MTRPAKLSLFLALFGAVLAAGCAGQHLRSEDTQAITIPNVTSDQAIDAIETTLRRMQFVVEKADAQAGVVRTLPLTGGQFFEFWRSDNVGAASTLEANLQTLRRSVRVDVFEADGQVHVQCITRVQRLSLPENEVASVSQAYRIHSHSRPTTQRIDLHPSQREAMHWIELGEDPKLAAEILRRIARNIEQSRKDQTT